MAGEGIIRGTLESNLNLNLLVQPSTLSPILVLSPSHDTYDAVDLQRSLKMVTPTPSLYSLKKKPSESSTVTIQSAANSIHTVSDDATVFDDKESTPKVTLPYSIFTPAQKRSIVLVVGAAALFSPLSANSYFPSIPTIAQDLKVSDEHVNLTITAFMIFQGITPSFWGAICDVVGRRPVYITTLTVYIVACIGLAHTEVYWLLVVLRCLQATGSASVIAIGGGTIGDIASPSERGGFMGAFSFGTMLGNTVGPVLGGLLGSAYGYKSVFWFLGVFAILVLLIIVVFLPETLRSIVGNGSLPAHGINRSLYSQFRTTASAVYSDDQLSAAPPRKSWRDIRPLAPFKMFGEKDVFLILTFNSVVYALFYCILASTALSFRSVYGLTQLQLGLCFLASGLGCLIGAATNGKRMNLNYAAMVTKMEDKRTKEFTEASEKGEVPVVDDTHRDLNDLSQFPIEQARMKTLPSSLAVLLTATLIYGWSLQHAVHLSVPIICQVFIGFAATTQFNSVATLMVDLYPSQSASATAANNLYRCLVGAAGTAFIEPLLRKLGPGPTFTLLVGIAMLFTPLMVIEWKYGMTFRAARVARLLAVQELKEAIALAEVKGKEVA